MSQPKKKLGRRVGKFFRENTSYYLMLLPAFLLGVIFCYIPMYGILYAFQDFYIGSPTWIFDPGVEWVGLKHFEAIFSSEYFGRTVWNTVRNSLMSLLLGFPIPIIFALLLNEIRHKYAKKTMQTISYLPHFISSVIVSGMILGMLAYDDGVINTVLERLGFDRINFMIEPDWFPWILILSGIWQSFGWNSIIFLASIAGIDPSYYEAADLDGANRLQKAWYITLPAISNTVVVILVMNIGSIMAGDQERILLLYNPAIYETADIIQTFSYREGLLNGNYSFGIAISLFISVINFIFVWLSNKLSNKVAGYGLW